MLFKNVVSWFKIVKIFKSHISWSIIVSSSRLNHLPKFACYFGETICTVVQMINVWDSCGLFCINVFLCGNFKRRLKWFDGIKKSNSVVDYKQVISPMFFKRNLYQVYIKTKAKPNKDVYQLLVLFYLKHLIFF